MSQESKPNPQESEWQAPPDTGLRPLRDKIDSIDEQVLVLLNERARLAQQIGALKAKDDAPVMRPEREAQVIARLQSHNTGPLGNNEIALVFREVMSACRAMEHRLRVAYLGPEGTYSEQAVGAHFGHSIDAVAQATVEDVFRSVETGESEFGVVPVENSTEGSVSRTLDALLSTSLCISGEVSLPIHHELLTQANTLSDVKVVCAHPQALAQCRLWLQAHLPHAEQRAVSSNAEGARLAQADATLAAIAGRTARERYALPALAEHIQDDPRNKTRFLVIGRLKAGPSGKDLTSLILSVKNESGAVYRLLEPLARHGVSMTRLESRPARTGRWEYYFYLDIEGHHTDAALSAALAELKSSVSFFKWLGSYPVAPELS